MVFTVTIAIDMALCIFLILIGYVAAVYFLNEVKWNKVRLDLLKPNSRNKVLYLILAVLVSAALITLFQTTYRESTLIHQMKIMTLVLSILPMAAVDYRHHIIPNAFILTALVIRIGFYAAEFIISSSTALVTLKDNLIGAAIIGGFFLLLLLIFKNSIGMGDIKLFSLMGLYQGVWGAVNAVFFSLLVSFFFSVYLLISRKKGRKDQIAFGPSILFGTVVAVALAGI